MEMTEVIGSLVVVLQAVQLAGNKGLRAFINQTLDERLGPLREDLDAVEERVGKLNRKLDAHLREAH